VPPGKEAGSQSLLQGKSPGDRRVAATTWECLPDAATGVDSDV